MGNTVTRFPNGVTNVAETDIFADLTRSDQTQYHTYFNDFDTYTAADWVVTETQAGATQTQAAGDGGWLVLTNSAADNDLNALQLGTSGQIGSFSFTAGKKAFFKARLKVSDATASYVVVGLQVADTTPLDVTDGVYFLKTKGAATVDIICRKNATTGSTSASAVATMVDDTFITLAYYYDGIDKVFYAVDGSVKGSISATSAYLPDTVTAVSFGVQNGAAAAKNLTVDFIYAAVQR